MRNSQNLPIDIWRYASAVDNRHPNANVYRFYYHSEVFQCLDTLFLMMIPVSVFVLVRYILTVSPMEISKIIFLGVYIFSMFFFHFLSKGISKAFDRRFFLDIEIGLMDCPDVDVSKDETSDDEK